ncbi:MAG: HD domain-containing protein [Caldilineales bacterium]|nr:HD domain-containing protein [Caldilineales bacterium]MDW8319042.1 HD domain-containing protein [Anaerolineae bacterium]
MPMVTAHDVQNDPELNAFIAAANGQLAALGYTEHGHRHARLVGQRAAEVLRRLGYAEREAELAYVAGYLHDIGNLIHRQSHALSGAMLAYQALTRLGMPPHEVAVVMGAIGNHEEEHGAPVSPVAAAVVLADKSDVHRSRVQNPDPAAYDIHDRVNYAATDTRLTVDPNARVITLEVQIDTRYAQVMDYFEIFLSRMVMMREAASLLGCDYHLVINNVRLS